MEKLINDCIFEAVSKPCDSVQKSKLLAYNNSFFFLNRNSERIRHTPTFFHINEQTNHMRSREAPFKFLKIPYHDKGEDFG